MFDGTPTASYAVAGGLSLPIAADSSLNGTGPKQELGADVVVASSHPNGQVLDVNTGFNEHLPEQ